MLRVHDARLLLQRGILLPAVSISDIPVEFHPKHHLFPGHSLATNGQLLGIAWVAPTTCQNWDHHFWRG